MPKRRRDEGGGGRAAKRWREERGGGRATKRRHLYLLFDDWLAGYSIRKLDLPSDEVDPDDPYGFQMDARGSVGGEMVCTGEQRLPPAIFRFEAQRGLPMYLAAAFDSKILALQPVAPAAALPSPLEHHFPVFDVRARSCLFAPRMETTGPDPIYIPAGGRLFALAAGTFDKLGPPLPPPPLDTAYGEEAREWSWLELPDPPFERNHVASYAVHPDGQTIFVGVKSRASADAATFAFNTAGVGDVWERRGKRALPFTGRAHFDRELDAWVGLSGDPGSIGHLCSCDVMPHARRPHAGSDGQLPPRKIGKEKLFSDDPTETHVGATLVYMGGRRSEFCLVQCVSVEDNCAYERSDCCNLDDEDDSADERNGCNLEEEEDYDDDDLLDDCNMEKGDGSADERKDSNKKEQDGSAAESVAEKESVCKQEEQDVSSRPRRYLFRLTTFNLKYDKKGDLTTGSSCRVQYYRVPKESTQALLSNPVAFWL